MAETETPQKAEKPSYHRDRLVAESEAFFGQPSHVVSAALDHHVRGGKKNLTREEAERAIKDFLDHKVEMSYGEQTGVPEEGEE